MLGKEVDVGSLEEQALRRRERLRALRQGGGPNSEATTENPENIEPLPKPKFRSYRPQDETLKESVLPKAPVGDISAEIQDQLQAANSKVIIDELDITNLAPRKPDWDLKRDVAKKLEKLERRTQKAIAELIWDRMKAGEKDNINAMVKLATEDPKTSKES